MPRILSNGILSYVILTRVALGAANAAPRNVCVYDDAGASAGAVGQTISALKHALPPTYQVLRCNAHTLRTTRWEEDTALLVMPGGRATPFKKALGPAGAERIRAFVEGGGAYLGLCAGGYFAAAHTDFFTGDAGGYEIHSEGMLNFYPGTCEGPVYRDFVYNSERGAHAARIGAMGQAFAVYQNGGGAFVDADRFADVDVIARFEDTRQAAIVQCPVGKGTAILTGVHPEFDPFTLPPNAGYQAGVLLALQADSQRSAELWSYLLTRLGLTTP